MVPKAVVLLSGGMDSTVVATLAAANHGAENVSALSINYGQKHSIELDAATKVASFLRLSEHIIMYLAQTTFEGAGSTLIDLDLKQPQMSYKELAETEGVSPTYVPFRNGTFLSLATAFALRRDAEYVYIATHAEDARNWAYPDCTPEFNGAMMNAIYIGTYHKVRLMTPLQWLMKEDIVRLGLQLRAPLSYTYSCYEGRPGLSCGLCPTCVERVHAFLMNEVVDPMMYAVEIDWSDCSPYEGP